MLRSAAHRLGLGAEEAEEVAQQTLVKVFDGIRQGQFRGGKGKFRNWMFAIARNVSIDILRRRRDGHHGDATPSQVPDEKRCTAVFTEEWTRSLLRQAFETLRDSSRFDPRSLRAFELLVLHSVPIGEVAAQCEMTEDQVYVAKSRVRAKFIELNEQLADAGGEG